jgi:zinc transporter ZupT
MENLGITLPELETSTILPSASIDGYILSIEKWVALCTLTFASIAFGLLPRWIFPKTPSASGLPGRKDYTQRKSYPRALALLSSFSGGVLLATTMLHILPEVREKAEHVAVSIFGLTLPTGFPLLSELLMLYGFCIIYLFEVVAHFFLKRHHNLNNNELSNKSLINGVEVSGQEGVKKAKGSWRVLISLVALSFHAVMEGVAVGVQVYIICLYVPDILCYITKMLSFLSISMLQDYGMHSEQSLPTNS